MSSQCSGADDFLLARKGFAPGARVDARNAAMLALARIEVEVDKWRERAHSEGGNWWDQLRRAERLDALVREVGEWSDTFHTGEVEAHVALDEIHDLLTAHAEKPEAQSWEGEHCDNCSEPYGYPWLAPDDVWAQITLSEYPEGGLLCIPCANRRARTLGLYLWWECAIGKYPARGRTEDGS